jgi:PAT family beta-lactamase induction signal transducer AmpG
VPKPTPRPDTGTQPQKSSLLRSKLFWVGVLYFSEGFPLGIFFEIFPVYFRQQGVDLRSIGMLSLLGLAWTLKFLWAPAVDHYRHHRLWMATVDLAMGAVMLFFAVTAGFGPWVWAAIGVFTVLSATNDIAIDGYTIEMLDKDELGLANGVRIGFYRVGMLASGVVLILSDWITWPGAFICSAAIFACTAFACRAAPPERVLPRVDSESLRGELARIIRQPRLLAMVLALALGALWLVDNVLHWSEGVANFWSAAIAIAAVLFFGAVLLNRRNAAPAGRANDLPTEEPRGPMFGALVELLERPHIIPVLAFILIFKLGDASMGFMVKPFWVDSGFSATEIGLVSVNIGLGLSIAGGLVGGWYTDRAGIFRALWVLGLLQALSNLGYAAVASMIAPAAAGADIALAHRALMYGASAAESFTGGLGTAAFLAFLMAIVDKRRSAAEYALLSSVFALSRSVAGWAGGFGAQELGYAAYFLLTFLLSFPAYALLPWVRRMLEANHAPAGTATAPATLR